MFFGFSFILLQLAVSMEYFLGFWFGIAHNGSSKKRKDIFERSRFKIQQNRLRFDSV